MHGKNKKTNDIYEKRKFPLFCIINIFTDSVPCLAESRGHCFNTCHTFDWRTQKPKSMHRGSKDNSRSVLAIILIVVGVFWLLGQLGVHFTFPRVFLENLFHPFKMIFTNWGHIIFSWPTILIIIGLILMAGNRKSGLVLLIIGGVFLLPRLFFIPGLTISILLPVVLIAIGIAMVVRKY